MVIGTSSVNMAATGSRMVKVGQKNQTLMKNVATGEIRYSENSFESTFTSSYQTGDGELLDDSREENPKVQDNNYVPTTLTSRQEESVNSLLK